MNGFSVSGCSTYVDDLQASTRDYFKQLKTNSENTYAYKQSVSSVELSNKLSMCTC